MKWVTPKLNKGKFNLERFLSTDGSIWDRFADETLIFQHAHVVAEERRSLCKGFM
jgi:hypothetical protein